MFDPSLYFVTSEIPTEGERWDTLIKEAVLGGVKMVQIRDKSSSTRTIVEAARKVLPFLRKNKVPLLINDRADIASVTGAQGVHLGQSDLTVKEARSFLGPHAIIGISVETMDHVKTIEGADYVAASPIFPTATKKDLSSYWGLEGLRRLKEKVKVPLVAIGGIKLEHLPDLFMNGADGIAVISAIAHASSPREVASEWIKTWKELTQAC